MTREISSGPTSPADVTRLLIEWRHGRQEALDRLMPLVYDELRAIARRYLAHESPSHTLQSTALVHEAFFKLVDQHSVHWQNRAHFFGIAAQMMRRILVDYARRRHRVKRGGSATKLLFNDHVSAAEGATDAVDLLALDEALTDLTALDPQQSRVVELRFFSGLTIEETAEVLGVSSGTVKREWRTARAWLYRRLQSGRV